MAAIEIDQEFGKIIPEGAPGGPYEVGVLQPAVIVVPKGQPNGEPMVSWSCVR